MNNCRIDIIRRQVVGSMLAFGALGPLARLSMAATQQAGANRLVFVILRGGMDGLYAVPAIGDSSFAAVRGVLAEYARPPLALSGLFALHPDLVELHAMYGRNELAVVHAVGLPHYRGRSHFDAQNMLETGGELPFALSSGWLGRALGNKVHAIGLSTTTPLALRGADNVDTWSPSTLPMPNLDLLDRLEQMYQEDPALAAALMRAKALRYGVSNEGMVDNGMMNGTTTSTNLATLASRAAEFLSRPDGPRVAMLEHDGWDSHGKENDPEGPIAHQMSKLDGALGALREGLQKGGAWGQTMVIVATEFGREVAVNGTGGTDHGSGGAAFVLGGAIKGGRVLGEVISIHSFHSKLKSLFEELQMIDLVSS